MTRLTYLLFLALCASLCFSACSKDDQDTKEEEEKEEEMNDETLSLTTPCMYDIIFDGRTIASDPTDEWLYCQVNRFSSTDDIGNIVIPNATIEDDDNNFNLYLSRGLLRVPGFNDVPQDADFDALFQTGQYDVTRYATEGIQLEYAVDGELWSTDNHNDGFDQTGSSFKIMEMVSGESGGGYYATIRGEFSCKLYNSAGDMKTSSGKVTIQFLNF